MHEKNKKIPSGAEECVEAYRAGGEKTDPQGVGRAIRMIVRTHALFQAEHFCTTRSRLFPVCSREPSFTARR